FKAGYTAPSLDGQERVVKEALDLAGIDPSTIQYVESHGTGTFIGDPIEVAALERVYKADVEQGSCLIGSVKTNIGHTNRAAGAISLIKTALSIHHQKVPATLHFEEPNPKIDFEQSPFRVVTELTPWERNGNPRRAALSAFGMGGTNAHTIVEEAPESPSPSESRDLQLLTLSAKTATALDTMSDNLADHLRQNPDLPLADVAYTLQVGRRRLGYHRALVCRDAEEAIQLLRERPGKKVVSQFFKTQQRSTVFMFPGQGSQDVSMGLELYRNEPVFREALDACAELLAPRLGLDLREVLYPEGSLDEARLKLQETRLTQPALFAVEYAMARLWMSL
ncbi:MAG: type I polyketide synthase, partial [Acidobacteriota bacterium]